MEKLDLKDKKILFQLLQDSRQSSSKIGKKVGQSKEFVSYRIKRMIDKGIIKKFTTMVDASKFGVVVLSYNFKFDNINPTIRNELMKFLVDSKYTRYVASTEGKYDMVVWFYYTNNTAFIKFYEEFLKKYRRYLANQILTGDLEVEVFLYDFLLSDSQRQIPKIKSKKSTSIWSPIDKFDDQDIFILKELCENPRVKIIEIAKELKVSANIVKYRIKKLIDSEVIFGFSADIDWLKIGYKYYTLEVILYDYKQKNKILNYLKTNPCFIKIFKSYGHGVDIKCDIMQYNIDQLRDTIENITNNFPNSIKNIDYYNTYKINKVYYLPPI
jgi:DNA-binding Lrp family transcriptional regulator